MSEEPLHVTSLAAVTERLRARAPRTLQVLPKERVAELCEELAVPVETLLQLLVPLARQHARPPISSYQVGAAGLGESGAVYLGVNLEVPGLALNQTVHAEQFVVTRAQQRGERRLLSLAVSAAPCGHCRQWLNETTCGAEIRVLLPSRPPVRLAELLPEAFGPRDLGVESALLAEQQHHLVLPALSTCADRDLAACALQGARGAYAPYSGSPSAVALRLVDGSVLVGSYAENAAFNPSLSPLQAALVALVAEGRGYAEVQAAMLVEPPAASVSQEACTAALLAAVAPAARLTVVHAALGLPRG